jgi:hypothetical protein
LVSEVIRTIKTVDMVGHLGIGKFEIPKVNLKANDYKELIDWSFYKITPPPILSDVTTEDLKSMLKEPIPIDSIFTNFPCHTQAVERTVKLIMKALKKVCGHKKQEGFISSTLKLKRSCLNLGEWDTTKPKRLTKQTFSLF